MAYNNGNNRPPGGGRYRPPQRPQQGQPQRPQNPQGIPPQQGGYGYGHPQQQSYQQPQYPGPADYSARQAAKMTHSPAEALEPSRGPNPPQKKKKRRQLHPFFAFINWSITLFLIGTVIIAAGFYYVKYQFYKQGPLNYSTVIVIPKGMGVNAIATKLEREGVITDKHIFIVSYLYFKRTEPQRLRSGLRFGEYEIPRAASMSRVLEKLTTGKPLLYKISLPEGLTSQQMVARINAHPNLSGEIVSLPPEGTLLPDTYKFKRNTNRQDLVRRLQAEQQKFIARLWPKRAEGLPIRTIDEALILASIVEKETGRSDERTRVASVFINRLRRGMRLQSDPTIIYGIVGGQGSLGRPIYRSEIRKKTPYNTYQINGLPPTPIANPGRAAIEAVLNPATTKDLFFVANGTGGHTFATNLKDHNKNVAKWRVIEKEIRKRQAAEKAAAEKAAKAQTNPSAATPKSQNGTGNAQVPLPQRKK